MKNKLTVHSETKRIELYYKSGGLLWVMFWLSFGLLMFVGCLGIFMPYMWFTDTSLKGYSELNGYVVFIAVCGWIIGGIIFLHIRNYYFIYKRRDIPVIFDSDGIRNLVNSRSASKNVDMPWQNIIKIARSVSRGRSFNKDRRGTLTAFYKQVDGKKIRCILDWGLFGFRDMQEQYQQIHYFIADHVNETCNLESYPGKWPKP